MCTDINNYVPVRRLFDDENEEEQRGCGFKDYMMAQFKKDYFYNKSFSLQDQGKDDPIDTLENGIKLWLNTIGNAQCPVPYYLYDYDYNDEGLDHSLRGAEIFLEIGDFKKYIGYTQK